MLIQEAYDKGLNVIRCSIHDTGIGASADPEGYTQLCWGRDSMISLLGGALTKEADIVSAFGRALRCLSKHQSERGQSPTCVVSHSIIDRGAVDPTPWYIIGQHYYKEVTGDSSIFDESTENIERAFRWLECSDQGHDHLMEQQEEMDWMDLLSHHGHVLYTNSVYYGALVIAGRAAESKLVRRAINTKLSGGQLPYYAAWEWKQARSERFDALANCLAILFGAAESEYVPQILDFIREEKLDRPYPIRVLYPPIYPGDPDWREYFREGNRCYPYRYHNGGIWPFVGGFYVAALVKDGRIGEAEEALERLAEANRQGELGEWEFREWLHGQTGHVSEPSSRWQTWSAAMYIFASECVKRREVPVFQRFEPML